MPSHLPRSWSKFGFTNYRRYRTRNHSETQRHYLDVGRLARTKSFSPNRVQTHPAIPAKPSFSALRVETPTFPHNCYRDRGQCIEYRLQDPHKTREPTALSPPAGVNPRYDRKPPGTFSTLPAQSGCVGGISSRKVAENLLVRRSNDESN